MENSEITKLFIDLTNDNELEWSIDISNLVNTFEANLDGIYDLTLIKSYRGTQPNIDMIIKEGSSIVTMYSAQPYDLSLYTLYESIMNINNTRDDFVEYLKETYSL